MWIPAIWRLKKVVHNYQEQGKNYDMYLKSEKLVHSNQEHEKNVSQLFRIGKKWFLAISSLTNTVAAIWLEIKVDRCYLETKNSSSQCQEQGKRLGHLFKVRKTGSQQLRARKKCFPAIQKWKNGFLAILSLTNTVAAIWIEIKVDPCYLETKKSSS